LLPHRRQSCNPEDSQWTKGRRKCDGFYQSRIRGMGLGIGEWVDLRFSVAIMYNISVLRRDRY